MKRFAGLMERHWEQNARAIADEVHANARAAALERGDRFHWSYVPKSLAVIWLQGFSEDSQFKVQFPPHLNGSAILQGSFFADCVDADLAHLWLSSEQAALEHEARSMSRQACF